MELLDRAATKMGSWGKLAKELGISRQQMSDLKQGRHKPSPFQVAKCAEIVGERWYDHALPALMAQEKTDAGRRFWQGKLERLATIGATVLLAASLGHLHPSGDSGNGLRAIVKSNDTVESNRYYVKQKILLLLAVLRAFLIPRRSLRPVIHPA